LIIHTNRKQLTGIKSLVLQENFKEIGVSILNTSPKTWANIYLFLALFSLLLLGVFTKSFSALIKRAVFSCDTDGLCPPASQIKLTDFLCFDLPQAPIFQHIMVAAIGTRICH